MKKHSFPTQKKLLKWTLNHEAVLEMAEEERFELSVGANPRRFSRPVHSTALPPLRSRTQIIPKFSV